MIAITGRRCLVFRVRRWQLSGSLKTWRHEFRSGGFAPAPLAGVNVLSEADRWFTDRSLHSSYKMRSGHRENEASAAEMGALTECRLSQFLGQIGTVSRGPLPCALRHCEKRPRLGGLRTVSFQGPT